MPHRPSRFAYFLILLVLATGTYLTIRELRRPVQTKTDEVHYHAAFAVYRDGVKVDFSGIQFMHIEPCVEGEVTHSPEEELLERAHLHDGNGEVVHVHRPDVSWGTLFANLKYDLPADAQGYIDGTIVDHILEQPIVAYERVIIFTGSLADVAIKYASLPDRAAIEQVEAKSESCGT